MPAGSETLEILIRTRGGKAAAGELQLVASKTDGVTGSTRRASTAQKDAATSGGRLAGSWKGMIGRAASLAGKVAGLGIAFLGLRALKDSVGTTTDFAKATLGLNKNLGLSIQQSSEWAAVAKTRNIATKALNMGFGTLAKNIKGANDGGQKQLETFQKLGVSQEALASNDFNRVLGETADGFAKLGPGPERTAISMQLLGRGWQTLMPLLRGGKVGMQDALALADKYGATLKGKTTKEVMALVKAERESKFATLGLSLTFGTTLAPMLTKAMMTFNEMVVAIRGGKGAWGALGKILKGTALVLKDVAGWLGKHTVALYGLLAVLATVGTGLAIYRTAIWAASVATRVWAVATGAATAAQWALNLAMTANPIGLVIAAVALLVAGYVLLYMKVKWFRDLINAVWPALVPVVMLVLGPIAAVGFAFVMLGKKASGTSQWIKNAFSNVVGFIRGLPGKIASAAVGMFDGIKDAFRSAINWVIRGWNALEFSVPEIDTHIPGVGKVGGGKIGVPDSPELGSGGMVRLGGAAIVGDRGRELLQETTGGAKVTPLEHGPALGAAGGTERVKLITVDGRVLAEAVFDAAATAEARA